MRTLVLHLGHHLHWALFEAPHAAPVRLGDGPPAPDATADRCWVLVRGTEATAHTVALPREANERRLTAAAAFALEEALAADPADLHFALGAAGEAKRLVVVASHAAMKSWTAQLAALGVKADLLLPDFLAISKGPISHDGLVLAKTAEGGFAAEASLAALVLDESQAGIPARSATEFLQDTYATLLLSAPVNLLQGAYAPKRDWGATFRPWRRAGALAAGVVLAVVASLAIEGLRLDRQAEAATARAEAVFRAALPEVKRVVNPRAQMRAHLQGANLTGGGFLALSEIVVGAVAAVPDSEITTLRFEAKRGEVAATFSLPSFEAVERVKAELAGRGGQVQEGGARQDGARILADVTVKQR